MFYDYIVTQFYPSIPFLVALQIVVCIVVIVFYIWNIQFSKDIEAFVAKWKSRLIIFLSVQGLILGIFHFLPDVEYVKYFYGEVRVQELTAQQKAELQAQYDKHYERSKQLLLDCLDKGQKQPQTTVYNDTNEVIKTCYDVAKYKF